MSATDPVLTDQERQVLAMYRDPAKSGWSRAVRLSVQYAVGGAVFLYLAISTGNPWWSAVVYALFVVWMAIRLAVARRLSHAMPSIIAKLERRIEELEKQANKKSAT